MTDWIFDRLPTRAEADHDGDVIVLVNKGDHEDVLFDWQYVDYRDILIGNWWVPGDTSRHRLPPYPLASIWRQSRQPAADKLAANEVWLRGAALASSIGASLRGRHIQGVAERVEELLVLVRSIGQEVTHE